MILVGMMQCNMGVDKASSLVGISHEFQQAVAGSPFIHQFGATYGDVGSMFCPGYPVHAPHPNLSPAFRAAEVGVLGGETSARLHFFQKNGT